MTYAAQTTVTVEKSRHEIETTLARYGAKSFGYFAEVGRVIVVFEASERRIRFDLPVPEGTKPADDKLRRSRWRALLLCIKAKLESVEAKIETFEEAFLSHVVMPDGLTVAQHVRPEIKRVYDGGEMRPLLSGPGGPARLAGPKAGGGT